MLNFIFLNYIISRLDKILIIYTLKLNSNRFIFLAKFLIEPNSKSYIFNLNLQKYKILDILENRKD